MMISTRVQQIQADMTYRALELLNLPPDQPAFLLDIGCGSGLSGEILDEEGYNWVGCDIAPSMLGQSAGMRRTVLGSWEFMFERWHSNVRSKETCSCKTLDKGSDSVLAALTEPSGE